MGRQLESLLTAAFAIVNGLLLRPLPFPEPDRLVVVAIRDARQTSTRPFSLREYRDLAAASRRPACSWRGPSSL